MDFMLPYQPQTPASNPASHFGSGSFESAAPSTTATAKSVLNPTFTDNSSADIIIRSASGVNYEVVGAILAAASPVFSDMFDVPQPAPEFGAAAEQRPVVQVTEDTTTLDMLLHICYPIRTPTFRSLEHALKVLEAGRKYMIDVVQHSCALYLKTVAAKSPMEVYLIACKYELEDVAKCAAQSALYLSLDDLLGCIRPETDLVSFACAQRLHGYRKACESELAAVLTPAAWLDPKKGRFREVTMPWVTSGIEIGRCPPLSTLYGAPAPIGFAPPAGNATQTGTAGADSGHTPSTSILFRNTSSKSKVNATDEEGHNSSCTTSVVHFPSATRLFVPFAGAPEPTGTSSATTRDWWLDYLDAMHNAFEDLHRTGRCRDLEEDALSKAMAAVVSCETCRATSFKELRAFEQTLQRDLDQTAEKIAKGLSFTRK